MLSVDNLSVWPDEALYAWKANVIARDMGAIFSPGVIEFHPPAFPFLLSFFKLLNIDPLAGSSVLNLFLIFTVVLLVFMSIRIVAQSLPAFLISIWILTNSFIYTISQRCLPDILQFSSFMLLHFLMLKTMSFNKLKDRRYLWAIAISAAFCLTVKWSGVLVFPILCVFILINRQHLSRRNMSFLLLPAIVTIIFLLLLNKIAFGTIFPYLAPLYGDLQQGSWWTYILSLNDVLRLPYPVILLFFILGTISVFKTKNKLLSLCFFSFIITLFFVSSAGEKQVRYALIFLPPLFILMGAGIDLLFVWGDKNLIRRIICSLLIAYASVTIFSDMLTHLKLLSCSRQGYTGYSAAAHWLKNNAPANSIIFTGSRRQMRYFTGLEFVEDGGLIFPVLMPKDHFHPVESTSLSSFLVVDSWEYAHQPDWIFPFNPAKKKALEDSGFRLVQEIKEPVCSMNTKKKCTWATVIWIFRYVHKIDKGV